ncbi:thioredoxin domain-containing protein 3 isoform X1 [Canis lupus familiaris]|uniref:Thioredoxin domain-containing protein 3 n=3 Tax=Canis lupus familiaris TaxID=9615 RepID=A0A8C0S947_CANLF|nr:thioredoxin domain-containing protein 3 isoform X1 [Canis lupus familiaris]XP_013976322.1 thioredoxin domain-containing protein 3 isoform X1 [Canis lupus familiaris]XP_038279661.1 thioredoxin domain-containing protein 3 isoform X1 [Canis lupus familiaris]XP_038279662.1 thioredoxin domain-containing protein 3 isoform X1 [Canis lupus familiaris]|eukprot:XP_013976321.1 thioredoxin domain-containing protein 3 isoform X1 [Canis lupus familiaris]
MAGKKREIQLQAVVNSQSLWDEMLQNKGLTVIDVYQAWCGPCKAMQPLFRKLKNELNEDELLHFVVAEADNIVTLQPFRDKCEPVFLFSVNGKIIARINGANAPLVNKKITNLINEEKKIAAGEMVRPQYREIVFVDSDVEDAGEAHSESAEQLYIIVIIKPDAVMTRKSLEIKKKIIEAGYVLEIEDKRVLTEQQAREFYSRKAEEPDFQDFVLFMTSGVSHILVISQGDEEQPDLKETEPDPEMEAKEADEDHHEEVRTPVKKKHDSLQEYLERQHVSQFCDIEENLTDTNHFIDILFPDFKNMKNLKLEKTLAFLRPRLFQEKREHVLKIIEDEGFKILMQRQIILSEEEAQTLCREYENEDYFENVIEQMTSGPSLALVLLRDCGLQHWKNLIGPSSVEKAKEHLPESLCVRFAMEDLPINQLYGSDSLEEAEKEIQYFFPSQDTLALIKPHVTHEQREEILKLIRETGFEITQMKEVVLNEEAAEKIYSKIKGRDFYQDVLQMLSEGPSLVMVLTKWNAVSDWRRLMGPIDPDEAKLLSPDSIRAHFGRSTLKNAVHGSSTIYEAMETISRMFEDFIPENHEGN